MLPMPCSDLILTLPQHPFASHGHGALTFVPGATYHARVGTHEPEPAQDGRLGSRWQKRRQKLCPSSIIVSGPALGAEPVQIALLKAAWTFCISWKLNSQEKLGAATMGVAVDLKKATRSCACLGKTWHDAADAAHSRARCSQRFSSLSHAWWAASMIMQAPSILMRSTIFPGTS